MKLSFGERLKIRRLQTHNVNWTAIASVIGCTQSEARDVVDQHYIRKLRQMKPKPRKKHKPFAEEYGPNVQPWASNGERVKVPPEVESDRERRALLYHGPFGDPQAGYSALDRRNGHKP